MAWMQLTLTTVESYARQLGDILMANGAQAVTYRDAQDAPIFEPGPGAVQLWSQTLVTGLYPAEVDLRPVLQNLAAVRFLEQPLQYKTDQLEDKDWERAWMDNFKPERFGRGCWIVPSWHAVPEPDEPHILLDPGMAFGTGSHPTTSLCLSWLTELSLSDQTVIDFGCGSGVLGIAALKLGAARCFGTDIDQQALQASQQNARDNQVGEAFSVYLPEHLPTTQADVVVANILAGPLQELAPTIKSLVKPGGQLAMSGILHRQAELVRQAYAPDIHFTAERHEGDWSLLIGTRV